MQEPWQPACETGLLQLRARMLASIREFFAGRQVLEVETPLLSLTAGTDPQLDFFTTEYCLPPQSQTLFLQTSPEFAMKRLLASGSGSIYQICKAFRNGESGRYHNPEFTLLEWYRVAFSLDQLMDECAELCWVLFAGELLQSVEKLSYQTIFQRYTGLDALEFCYEDYNRYTQQNGFAEASAICRDNHSLWLDFIFSHAVQPNFAGSVLTMIHGYPACLSSLARYNPADGRVTERFELFIGGIELGNGYHELLDPVEQNRRFEHEIRQRHDHGRSVPVKDTRLLAALRHGMPACSGVAIGLDRLLMLLSNSDHISKVIAFPINTA
ncbi:MAG: EF-P lysine aminoacylase GenX [Methylobacter sp.]|nr:MAG: EF-P lysine aminoacylase GenX [Methylobacter sp.]PPD32170.1 MAG: EF-P lysine aminoacylase GenX [Methylomonas sp.]